MKYAFILGSNVFIVPNNTISYTDQEQTTRFLRINSVYHDPEPGQQRVALTIDADIKDTDGQTLRLTNNQTDNTSGLQIHEQFDRIQVTRADGHTVLDVHQLDHKTAMGLEHNIIAELEVHAPVAVIRLRGNFMAGDLHIEIDNEKLFIDKDSYANSALAGHTDLKFSHSGVVI